jgi:hypothetical protein
MKIPSPQPHASLSRRSTLKGGWTLGAAGVLGSFAPAALPVPTDKIKKGDVILFQGDSITDAGRKKDRAMANDSEPLGKSYAAMIAGDLLAEEMNLTFVPFHAMFQEAAKTIDKKFRAGDGIHPTIPGHTLMRKAWRQAVGIQLASLRLRPKTARHKTQDWNAP